MRIKQSMSIPLLAATMVFLMSFTPESRKEKKLINGLLWNEITHDFGDFMIGPDATTTFIFKNKRKKPVQVKSVEPGCSCTVSDFSSEEIKRNKKGEIKATYKTKERPGYFKKFIKVTFTDSTEQELVITGNIIFEPKY